MVSGGFRKTQAVKSSHSAISRWLTHSRYGKYRLAPVLGSFSRLKQRRASWKSGWGPGSDKLRGKGCHKSSLRCEAGSQSNRSDSKQHLIDYFSYWTNHRFVLFVTHWLDLWNHLSSLHQEDIHFKLEIPVRIENFPFERQISCNHPSTYYFQHCISLENFGYVLFFAYYLKAGPQTAFLHHLSVSHFNRLDCWPDRICLCAMTSWRLAQSNVDPWQVQLSLLAP